MHIDVVTCSECMRRCGHQMWNEFTRAWFWPGKSGQYISLNYAKCGFSGLKFSAAWRKWKLAGWELLISDVQTAKDDFRFAEIKFRCPSLSAHEQVSLSARHSDCVVESERCWCSNHHEIFSSMRNARWHTLFELPRCCTAPIRTVWKCMSQLPSWAMWCSLGKAAGDPESDKKCLQA